MKIGLAANFHNESTEIYIFRYGIRKLGQCSLDEMYRETVNGEDVEDLEEKSPESLLPAARKVLQTLPDGLLKQTLEECCEVTSVVGNVKELEYVFNIAMYDALHPPKPLEAVQAQEFIKDENKM